MGATGFFKSSKQKNLSPDPEKTPKQNFSFQIRLIELNE